MPMPQPLMPKEAGVERFYDDLQDLLELTPKTDILFIIGDWNAKAGRDTCKRQVNKQVWSWNIK